LESPNVSGRASVLSFVFNQPLLGVVATIWERCVTSSVQKEADTENRLVDHPLELAANLARPTSLSLDDERRSAEENSFSKNGNDYSVK
jgi:hypothetical protein